MSHVVTAPQSPVLNTSDLASLLARGKNLVLIDCRFNLGDLTWGAKEYNASHLPGAVYADLEQHLSGPIVRGVTGRHPLPAPDVFARTAGAWGIDANTLVVAYDDGSCMFAPRLWWLFTFLGHTNVTVLRGGIKAWVAANGALSSDVPTPTPKTFVAKPNAGMVASLDEVESYVARGDGSACLLDARAEPRFRGEQEPIDPVAGHIPNARNLPFTQLLDAGGPKSKSEIQALFDAAVAAHRATDVIAYCGSGVTACALIWAAACAGVSGIRLYPGSWSEWVTAPSRPVAKG